jgi:hypothetical protein
MQFALYVIVKLLCYSGWCWLGLRIWRRAEATVPKALGYGIIRLAIGIGFGVGVFFSVNVSRTDLLWKYLEIYAPIRLVEWLIVALMLRRGSSQFTWGSALLWCLGGILISFAADLASPEGLAGHFCIGRCLC